MEKHIHLPAAFSQITNTGPTFSYINIIVECIAALPAYCIEVTHIITDKALRIMCVWNFYHFWQTWKQQTLRGRVITPPVTSWKETWTNTEVRHEGVHHFPDLRKTAKVKWSILQLVILLTDTESGRINLPASDYDSADYLGGSLHEYKSKAWKIS